MTPKRRVINLSWFFLFDNHVKKTFWLVAEEKELTAIVNLTSCSTDASVLMQIEKLNLVIFDPHYDI